jgi:hypothetical protein
MGEPLADRHPAVMCTAAQRMAAGDGAMTANDGRG